MLAFYFIVASIIGLAVTSPNPPSWHPHLHPHPPFDNVTIFTPPRNWTSHRTSYAQTVLLEHGGSKGDTLLASWSFSPPGRVYAPIYQSQDGGFSWKELSKVYFSKAASAGSIILQVFLYELPQMFGGYPAGTILLTANSIPADRSSTNIELYASTDKGYSLHPLTPSLHITYYHPPDIHSPTSPPPPPAAPPTPPTAPPPSGSP